MRVGLDERVLHGFVGVGRIAQVVPGDARRPALLPRDDLREQVARRVVVAGGEQVLHLGGERRFDLGRARRSVRGERSLADGSVDRSGKCRAASRHLIVPTHGYDYAGLSFTDGYRDCARET